MTAALRLILLLAALCAALPMMRPLPARAQDTAAVDSSRQILVMLRQRPQHFRPNADYGGGYGDTLTASARERTGRRIARAHGLEMAGNWPMPLIGLDCIVMTVPEGRTNEAAAAEVAHDPGVEWAQPMHIYQTRGAPAQDNDPLYSAEPAARLWHLADLHRMATGKGVTVAVIDTQIDVHHPDLAGQVTHSENFVDGHPARPELHGTAIAGVIAARADNGIGIAGVAPGARLMGLRACWQLPGPAGSVCDSLSLAKALEFAIEHHAQVINMSLSGPADILLERLIAVGIERGATVVAAYDPVLPNGGFPASEHGVIAVADKAMATLPPGVYTAPGLDVPTTEPGGKWYLVNGSSYAAAHVSGLAALSRELHPPGPDGLSLISAHRHGGAIDAWATIAWAEHACEGRCSREVAEVRHP